MVSVAVGDHHEVEAGEVDSQRPPIPGEDRRIVAGIEQDALPTVLNQGRKPPVPNQSWPSTECIVENRDSIRGRSWRGVEPGNEDADEQEHKPDLKSAHT
jgi:hypothetical protein